MIRKTSNSKEKDNLGEVAKHGLTIQTFSIVLLGIIMWLILRQTPNSNDLSSFFLGLLSSLIASALYSFTSIRSQKSLVKLTAIETSDMIADTVAQRIATLPSKTFPSGSTSDPTFEAHFLEQFKNSRSYWFKGVSGVITANRIQRLCRLNTIDASKEIRMLMLNPSDTRLLTEHTKFRRHGSQWSNKDYEQQVKKLQDDLLAVIVLLHPFSQTHNIDIRFHDEFCVARIELFDNGHYLSYYHGGSDYPGTEFYSSESKSFDAYRTAFASYFQDINLFSLSQMKNKPIEEILSKLNFPEYIHNVDLLRTRFDDKPLR